MDIYTLQSLGFVRARGKETLFILRIGPEIIECFEAKESLETDFFTMGNEKHVFFYKKIIPPRKLLETIYEIGKQVARNEIIFDIKEKYGD